MEFQHGREMFGSFSVQSFTDNTSSDAGNDNLTTFLEGNWMDLVDSSQYEVFTGFEDQSSVPDEEVIVDIESIDELNGIMQSPARFSQAFSSINAIRTSSSGMPTSIQLLPGVSKAIQEPTTFAILQSPQKARIRHNSEQIINELIQVELSADAIQMDGSLVPTKLDDDDFSLLGIDSIEAEDLETLFQQFEGATKSPVRVKISPNISSKPKPRPLTLEDYRKMRSVGPSSSEMICGSIQANTMNSVRKIGFTPPAFSRGLPVARKNVSVQKPRMPVRSVGLPGSQGSKQKQGSLTTEKVLTPQSTQDASSSAAKQRQLQHSVAKVAKLSTDKATNPKSLLHSTPSVPLDKLKVMPLPLMHPPPPLVRTKKSQVEKTMKETTISISVSEPAKAEPMHGNPKLTAAHNHSQTIPPAVAVIQPIQHSIIVQDHDYCKPFEAPSRNIKAELTMILDKIPEYLADASSTHSSQTQAAAADNKLSINCSCNSHTSKSSISLESSAHAKSSSKVADDIKPVELPKAYTLPRRGRPRKRRYRRRSPSSSWSNSSGSSSDTDTYSDASDLESSCSSCDSCCSFSTKDRHKSSRKRRRKSTDKGGKRRRSPRHAKSTRGRHKVKTSVHSSRRRRHKSARSSRSVSPNSCSSSSSLSRPSSPSSMSLSALKRKREEQAHAKAMAERRVVYVGGIDEKYTKTDLRKRFGGFGEIESVKTRLRSSGGENYGFVTFYSKADAYAAIEKGNDVYGPKFNLGFGGRRNFCDTEYADLDGCQAVKEEWAPSMFSRHRADDDFDLLLQQSIKKIKK